MKYAQIREYDVANGEGVRVSFFVTGCDHHCYNCFNKEYQDENFGYEWTNETTNTIIEYLKRKQIKGLSVLGGEPFNHPIALKNILTEIKKHTDKDIWVWSGFTLEEILLDKDKLELLREIDVLVDGRFINKLKDLRLKFRGSSNQRIIDVQRTLKENKIVLYEPQ